MYFMNKDRLTPVSYTHLDVYKRQVENTAYSESLWKKIDEFTIRYREMYTTDSIKDMVCLLYTSRCV